jgi:hypothetical protein
MGNRLEPWQIDLIKAVPNDVMRDIAEDRKAHNVILSRGGVGTAKDNQEPPRPNTHGWVDAPSTSKWQRESGIDAVDRLCDAQDQIDRAERIRQLAETARHLQAEAEAKKQLEEKGSQK